jgi:hypothetical protein
VTRRGRLPAAAAAARLSLAREIVAGDPTINGAALAAELSATLGVTPPIAASEGLRLLAELRAVGDAPPPAGVAADGRELARPIVGAAPRYRLRPETVARLAEVTGRPVGEDVDGQVCELLNRATLGTTPEAALDRLDPARSGEE